MDGPVFPDPPPVPLEPVTESFCSCCAEGTVASAAASVAASAEAARNRFCQQTLSSRPILGKPAANPALPVLFPGI